MSDTHGAQGTGAGADAGAAAAAAAAAAAGAGAKPWFDGKADAETIGYFQNRGWDKDPVTAAIEASKAHRAAEKHLGAPADQLIRLPKDAKDEAGWNSVYQRLGKPIDPKGYDFSDVKFADGSALADSFADTIKKAAWENHLSKDAATAFARALTKHAEANDAAEALDVKAKWDAGVARIKENWGAAFNQNTLQAMEGSRKLLAQGMGLNNQQAQEVYDNMAKAVGVDIVAEMFRRIGAGISEDKLIEGGGGALPATVEAAKAEKQALLQDKEWVARYRKGGVAEKRQMHNLNQIITNVIDTAA